MPGRHAAEGHVSPRRNHDPSPGPDSGRGKGLIVLIIVLAIVVPLGAFVGLRELRLSTIGQGSVPCTGSLRVRLSAAPEIVTPLRSVAARIAAAKVPVDGRCIAFEISAAKPRDVFDRLAGSTADAAGTAANPPELWIPDSWEWVTRRGIPRDRMLSLSPSVAASPLVLATTKAAAEAARSRLSSWASLAPAAPMALADPEKSGVALNALLAIRRSLSDEPDAARRQLGTDILQLGKQRVDDLDAELDQAGEAGGLRHGVPATEQRLLSFRRDHPQADIVPVVPTSGTVLLDYPLLAIVHGTKPQDGRLVEAGNTLMRYVNAAGGRSALRKAGFRDPRDQVAPSGPDSVGNVKILPPATVRDSDDVLRTWAATSLRSRLLAVVDVSRSMGVLAGDRSRIEHVSAAARAAVSYFPDTSEIGLWEFSQGRDATRGYLQVAPTSQLSPAHRTEVDRGLARLPDQVGGGTTLYDTFLAAYRAAQSSYDPSRVNSLVLLTDACSADSSASTCKGEAASGSALDQMVDHLEVDRTRPISVILVGIGPDADIGSLQRIAETVGGRTYRARDADTLEGIVVDSMLRRQCTSACA